MSSSRQTIRQIVAAFVADEEKFLNAARSAAGQESVSDATERFLYLAELRGFEDFFSWISRRDPGLMQPCRWLVFGPALATDVREPPTFGELQRLMQRVRETRPDFKPLLRQILGKSVLSAVETQPMQPAAVPPVRVTGNGSGVCP